MEHKHEALFRNRIIKQLLSLFYLRISFVFFNYVVGLLIKLFVRCYWIDVMEIRDTYLISIVVPIYNVEKYVEDCVYSITNQSYKNIEIILIDDGSNDKSGVICDELARKDNRIRVIHKMNGGLSDARNAGIEIATGDYIGFVDGDDIINTRMYEILIKNACYYNADISFCDYQSFYESILPESTNNSKIKIFNSMEFVNSYVCGDQEYNITPSVWTRIFKRDVIGSERFPAGRCFEDLVWTVKVASNTARIVCTNDRLYYYRTRNDSITNSKSTYGINSKMLTDRVTEYERMCNYLASMEYDETANQANYLYIRMLLDYYTRIKIYKINEFEFYSDTLRNKILEKKLWLNRQIKKTNRLSKKILLILMKYPDLFAFMWGVKYRWKKEND